MRLLVLVVLVVLAVLVVVVVVVGGGGASLWGLPGLLGASWRLNLVCFWKVPVASWSFPVKPPAACCQQQHQQHQHHQHHQLWGFVGDLLVLPRGSFWGLPGLLVASWGLNPGAFWGHPLAFWVCSGAKALAKHQHTCKPSNCNTRARQSERESKLRQQSYQFFCPKAKKGAGAQELFASSGLV